MSLSMWYEKQQQTTLSMRLEQEGDLPQQSRLMCRCQCSGRMRTLLHQSQFEMRGKICQVYLFIGQAQVVIVSSFHFSVFHVDFEPPGRFEAACRQENKTQQLEKGRSSVHLGG